MVQAERRSFWTQGVSISVPQRRFDLLSQGRILVHRAVGDPFWALTDGCVEFHESDAESLAREIEEAIGCKASGSGVL
jgi:8-oxo-dGTP pyrophosphatase MutT (NUDIX family)